MPTELNGGQSIAAMFARAVDAMEGELPPEAAHAFLALKLVPADEERLAFLSEQAQEGALTQIEREELELFLSFGRLLEVLKSKARKALKAEKSRDKDLIHP